MSNTYNPITIKIALKNADAFDNINDWITASSWDRYATRILNKPEYTYHQTQQKYDHPIIDSNPDSKMKTVGYSGDQFGPGHYTTSNPSVIDGYKTDSDYNYGGQSYTRKLRLPRGTKILEWNRIPASEAQSIGDVIHTAYRPNKRRVDFTYQNFNEDGTSPETKEEKLYTLGQILNEYGLNKKEPVNHLLKDMGYDVIQYSPYMHFEPQDEKNTNKGDNYLILNDQIINNPREFTKERLLPDYKAEDKNTLSDIYNRALDNNKLKPAQIPEKYLNFDDIKKRALLGEFEGIDEVPNFLLSDPEVAMSLLKHKTIFFRDLPEVITQDPDFTLRAYNNGLINFNDLADEIQNNVQFALQEYDNGNIPFYALPNSLKDDPNFVLGQIIKGEATPDAIGHELKKDDNFIIKLAELGYIRSSTDLPASWHIHPKKIAYLVLKKWLPLNKITNLILRDKVTEILNTQNETGLVGNTWIPTPKQTQAPYINPVYPNLIKPMQNMHSIQPDETEDNAPANITALASLKQRQTPRFRKNYKTV